VTARRNDIRLLLAALLLTLAGLALVPTSEQARAATGHQVVMSGYAFSPRTLVVTAGSTVTWTNQDTAPHDVETTSGPAFVHSPMLDKGGSWSHTFTAPGTYTYLCTVHPGMTAQLVVQPAATPHPTHTHSTAPAAPATHHTAARQSPSASATTPTSAGSSSTSPAPAAVQPTASPQTTLTTQPASAARPLDPLLLLAGVVAGIAVLCLLLVGSRSAAARSGGTE
jgi:amicyanin